MVGSVCRSDVHSHYLAQNNCIEPKVNCTYCEEFENKLKEALVELSSVQLITKLLQKDLSMVLGSEHNHRCKMSLLQKQVVNQQPVLNASQQIKME